MATYSASATISTGNIIQQNFAPQAGVAIHVPLDGVAVRVLELTAVTTSNGQSILIERYRHDNYDLKVVPLPGQYTEFLPESFAPGEMTGPPYCRAQLQWGWSKNPVCDQVGIFMRRLPSRTAGANYVVTFPRGLVIPPGQGIWWRQGLISGISSYTAVIEMGG